MPGRGAGTAVPEPLTGFPGHVVQHLLLAMLGPLLWPLPRRSPWRGGSLPRTGRRVLFLGGAQPGRRRVTLAPVVLPDPGCRWPYLYYLTPLYGARTSTVVTGVPARTRCPRRLPAELVPHRVFIHRPVVPTSGPPDGAVVAAAVTTSSRNSCFPSTSRDRRNSDKSRAAPRSRYYGGTLIEVLLAITVMTTWSGRVAAHCGQHVRRARSLNRVNAPIMPPRRNAAPHVLEFRGN